MAKEKEVKIEEPINKKFRSRTFWLTVLWTAFVPIALVAQAFLKEVEFPLTTLVTLAGTITVMYIGGNKADKIVNTMNLNKK